MSHKIHMQFSATVDILVDVGMLRNSPQALANALLEWKEMHRLLGEKATFRLEGAREVTPSTGLVPHVDIKFEYKPVLPLREIQ